MRSATCLKSNINNNNNNNNNKVKTLRKFLIKFVLPVSLTMVYPMSCV